MYHRPPYLVRRSPHAIDFDRRGGRFRRPRRLARTYLFAAVHVAFLSGCGGEGTGPAANEQRIRLVDGDGQVAPAGQILGQPLRVRITDPATGVGQPGQTVRWQVTIGAGASLNPLSSTTDADGVAQTNLTLGSQPGPYRVSASSEGAPGVVTFDATALELLSLVGLSTNTAAAGDRLEILGTGFGSTEGPRVEFSGVPGTIVSVSTSSIFVDVPQCLPSRAVNVTVIQAGERTDAVPLAVSSTGSAVDLALGEDLILAAAGPLACRRLGMSAGEEYIVAVRSDDVLGGGSHAYSLRALGLSGDISTADALRVSAEDGGGGPVDAAAAWHVRLRTHGVAVPMASRAGLAQASAAPVVGDSARFPVLTRSGTPDTVLAVARYVGATLAVYMDVDAPEAGLTLGDLESLAREFDDPVQPLVTSVFGPAPDLDGNGRVIALFTPAVNRLTARGSASTIAGFFFNADLLPGASGTPRGEILYALVPDPEGQFSDPVDRDAVMRTVPSVLAHELQHLVHFNGRVLERGAAQPEALWVAEALAQMAEELVYQHFEGTGDPARAEKYRTGNLDRARRYLLDTGAVGLTVSQGAGTAEERGAGWLFARYLADHFGGSRVLTDVANGSGLGTENVVSATGEPWTRTFSDWTIALALDDLDVGPPRFAFPSVSLSELVAGEGAAAVERGIDGRTFERNGVVSSASARYTSIEPTGNREIAVTLTGPDGGPLQSGAELRVRIVRIR